MIGRIPRKVQTVLRYFFPAARDRAYLRALRREGGFDRAFYLKAHPGLHPLFRMMPQRHYVQFGEAGGLSPNARFSPRAYMHHNPDLDPALVRPLLHYLQHGRASARTVRDDGQATELALPQINPAPLGAKTAPVAIVLHLYYLNMWEEFAALLREQTFQFDLFVTLTQNAGGEADVLKSRIEAEWPAARVWCLPNHGRDIFPFVYLVNSGVLAPYAAICKLHSKKSPHRSDGDDWRRDLTGGVLGDPAITQVRLARFLADPNAGFWVTDGQLYRGDAQWGVNRPRAEELLARTGRILPPVVPLAFPAGSIYWAKRAVIDALRALVLTPQDFEPEQALVDGTTPHAIERLLGSLAQLAALDIREAHDLDVPQP